MSAHETALKKAKLDQTWASLLEMAQNPPQNLAASLASAKEEVELLHRKAELLEVVNPPLVSPPLLSHIYQYHTFLEDRCFPNKVSSLY